MSINKNAYIRYQTLDMCFSNHYKIYFIEDLLYEVNKSLEEFNGYDTNIQKRQLFDDIKFMESEAGFSIPLKRIKSGKKVYYQYSDKEFSIKNQKIKDEEIETINSALLVLLRFKGIPQFEWVNELSTKLQSLFKQENLPELINFDQNEFLQGLENLPKLYQSIINKTVLRIEYQSFKELQPKTLFIHPYYLKQYNKRWFLFGLNNHDNLIYNLPLDRIKSFQIEPMKYIKNTEDFSEYFDDIIGVSKTSETKPIKIDLFFDKIIAPYILTKPIHGSQKKISENPKGIQIQINVIPNVELKQLLLSFGDNLEIISPKIFKDEFINTIDEMKKNYLKQL